MERLAWLDALQVGDIVFVRDGSTRRCAVAEFRGWRAADQGSVCCTVSLRSDWFDWLTSQQLLVGTCGAVVDVPPYALEPLRW